MVDLQMSEATEAISMAGKVVVVTGGARGIGLAIVCLAAELGARVVACDLTFPDNTAIQMPTNDFVALTGDVACQQDCEHFVNEAVNRFGRIDVLINNAGILERSRSTVAQDLADWKKVVDVNLQGTFVMSQAVARSMIDHGTGGSIINIGSVVGLSGFRAQNAYGVSKAGVAMLTKTLAADLARYNIRVNAVAPGFINTAMTENLGDTTPVNRHAFIERIPLGRFGEAGEIARAVLFLASNWASYITGAILPVDGGWLAFGGPGEG